MHLNYYYIENGVKTPANIDDLKVNYKSINTNLHTKYPFVFKCSLDNENKKLRLEIKTKKFSCAFVRAAGFYENQALKTTLSKVLNIKNGTHIYISISFTKNFIDFFSTNEKKFVAIVIDTKVNEEKVALSLNLKVKLPLVEQNVLQYNPPVSKFPSKIVRGICVQNFKMNNQSSKEEIEQCIVLEEFKILGLNDRYRVHGYAKMLELFLDIENSFEMDLLEKFDLNNVVAVKIPGRNNHHKINTNGQVPSIANFIELIPMDIYLNKNNSPAVLNEHKFSARIITFFPKHIEVKITEKKKGQKFNEKTSYHMSFIPNFFSSAMAKHAIMHIKKQGFEEYMLNFTLDQNSKLSNDTPRTLKKVINSIKGLSLDDLKSKMLKKFNDKDFKWMNKQIETNEAQKLAVKSIVNRTSFPSPFIVFGGPGTGKTSMAVEAISQIFKLYPYSRILVTTNSNSACDEIGDRLLKYIGPNFLYRFYSPSLICRLHKVSSNLIRYSNLKNGQHKQPSIQEIMSYNVVISTLVNSGRLSILPQNYFDFIFIDECASVTEAYVNIPIALAVNKKADFNTSIILLGDFKQLGQITRTFHTERYGFNVSMMERIMTLSNYKFDKQTGYNSNYIVQLTDNFRSHKSIIKYSNHEFYNSQLRSCQKQEIANFAIGWKHLPNKNCPVIFHASWTKSTEDGTSLFNNGDINFIMKYVKSLLKDGINEKKVSPEDIGIISPYAAQREKLKAIYTNGIEIGTVEYFQGREKLIIILSCVRSKTKTIGFLKNEKRLNVALTRAKALMIVIGNPETLGQNKYWRNFMTFCKGKNAIIGKIPNWIFKKTKRDLKFIDDEDNVMRMEELMNAITFEE